MRFFKGLAGVLAGTGLIATGATVVAGCGEDFDGCEASRTCKQPAPSAGGMAGTSTGGDAGNGGKSGSAGSSGGKGGSAGKSGSSSGGKGGGGGKSGAPSEAGAGGVDEMQGSSGDTGGGAVAGMTSSGDGGESGGDSGPPIDQAPYIVATSPANGATGVLADAEIVVTFSEPMDNESTQAAYSSDDLPPDTVVLTWTENSTKLHIRPKDPLVYANVDHLGDQGRRYLFTIGGTATDVSGNPLGDDRNYGFTTMRNVTAILVLPENLPSRDLRHPTDGSPDRELDTCVGNDTKLHAGDTADNEALAFVIAFDLSLLPNGVLDWTSATMYGDFGTTARAPFPRLGDMVAYAVEGDLESLNWDAEPVLNLGPAATYGTSGNYEVDVLEAIEREYEHRDEYPFSVLFRFEDDTDDDEEASYLIAACDKVRLRVAFTGP